MRSLLVAKGLAGFSHAFRANTVLIFDAVLIFEKSQIKPLLKTLTAQDLATPLLLRYVAIRGLLFRKTRRSQGKQDVRTGQQQAVFD